MAANVGQVPVVAPVVVEGTGQEKGKKPDKVAFVIETILWLDLTKEVLDTVEKWKELALAKKNEYEFETFGHSRRILRGISQLLNNTEESEQDLRPAERVGFCDACIVVRNEQTKEIESLACVKNLGQKYPKGFAQSDTPANSCCYEVQFLATHPKNIQHASNLEPVRGAGTRAVEAIKEYARVNSSGKGHSVYLTGEPNNEDFYKARGFYPLSKLFRTCMEWSSP